MELKKLKLMPFLQMLIGINVEIKLLLTYLKLHQKLVMKTSINLMKKIHFIDQLNKEEKQGIEKWIWTLLDTLIKLMWKQKSQCLLMF
jgi:hypothetical protein